MRMAAIERQALAHDEWMVVLTTVAKTAYKLADTQSPALVEELKALRVAEQAAKARFEQALCDAFEEPELLVETVELADPDQVTAQIPAEVLAQLVKESSR